MKRRNLLAVFAALILLPASNSYAQADRYLEGTHYQKLDSPVRVQDPNKIEVLEVFWYGCPACYTFEPILNNWVENRPSDTAFARFPAVFNRLMKVHAQIYYLAEAMDVLEQTHDKVFDALVPQRRSIQTEQHVVDLFSEFGFDKEETAKAFNSFAVRTKTNQAEKLTRDYGPRGTPSMVVNGEYVVSIAGPVNSQQEMLRVVDFLIEKSRSE